MKESAFLIARLTLAVSMFGHGLVRLPKLGAFSQWMVDTFSQSMMPAIVVKPFSIVLPILEFATGLLLLAGLFTRKALIVGAGIILSLIFGSCLLENWEWVSFQMFYGLFFSLLLANIEYNTYSLDHNFKIK